MTNPNPTPKKLYRTVGTQRAIAGVCGGVAKYLDMDPTIVRVLWIVGAFVSAGVAIIAYIVMWIVVPEEPGGPSIVENTFAAAKS